MRDSLKITKLDKSISQYDECVFEDCDFSNLELVSWHFSDVKFIRCNFSLCSFIGSTLAGVEFEGCKLAGVKLTKLVGMLQQISATNCNFDYATILDLDLTATKFENCTFQEAYLANLNLTKATFAGCDFLKAKFEDCDLRKADFTKARNYLIDSTRNKLKSAKFSLPEAANLLRNLEIELVK